MSDISEGIAIIGIACKFPGAKNKEEFWNNLLDEKETIKHFSDEELIKNEFNIASLLKNPGYVKARGVLEDVDKWDANFFNVIPKDARELDPQQRLWLETAWEAFEDAGCDPFQYKGIAGVYAGSYFNSYLLNNLLRDPASYELYIRGRTPEIFQAYINSDPMFLATRTAYYFNLKGPAVNVQTACSTSLVAVCQACNSLMSYETDLCIAGGATVLIPQETGYMYQEGAIGSPDGHCKPFDKSSKGTVFGNGVGVVILKRLQDAINDNDNIYAVIKGWATNNDGNEKIGFTAPSIEGQSKVISSAHAFANINAGDIRYIEAHGTATPLGDPIEVAALTKAFRKSTDKNQYCGLGSVKSNIGHLDAAAGVAGLIKIALSTHYRRVPATLHFSGPNPMLNIESTPFYIQNTLKRFDKNENLLMGVSSFGIGGTNAHVVLGEPPSKERINKPSILPELIVLSAKTESALKARKTQIVEYLEKYPATRLSDLAFTSQTGRRHMEYRTCIAATSFDEIKKLLPTSNETKIEQPLRSLAFAFPGQGAQYVGMGQQLYTSSPVFKTNLDTCFKIYEKETGESLKEILFAQGDEKQVDSILAQTKYTQPALFCIEYSLAKLYISYGIEPTVMIGHSVGEYAAACVAGVLDLSSGLKIVIKRGELMQSMPTGKMIAASCSKEKIANLSSDLFEFAADNSHDNCTISFPTENLGPVQKLLEQNEISFTLLNTSHAFHSKSFIPILDEFKNYVNEFECKAPTIPFISSLTGTFITDEEACSGEYWANQLRHTVNFREGISSILKNDKTVFLEVGPNTHLSSLIRRNKDFVNKKLVINSLGKPDNRSEISNIIQSMGELWAVGYKIIFEKVRNLNEEAHKITLPTYPWEKKRFWIDYSQKNNEQIVSTRIQEEEIEEDKSQVASTGLLSEIKALLSEQSGYPVDELNETSHFANLGFDSLFLAQFARNIERKYKISIAFRQLIQDYTNIKDLCAYIDSFDHKEIEKEEGSDKKLNNLALIQPLGDKIPLFLIFGEEAFSFKPDHFGTDRPFYTYVHLGADGEKVNFQGVDQIATMFLEQLLKARPKGPYHLGGFSFGGILAFEIAVRLQELGHKVLSLIILDCKNPAIKEPQRDLSDKLLKRNPLKRITRKLLRKFRFLTYKVYFLFKVPLPVKRRQEYITASYLKLLADYQPKKFNGDILLVRATDNDSAHKFLGWDGVVNKVELIMLEGNHRNVLRKEKNIHFISRMVKEYLDGRDVM